MTILSSPSWSVGAAEVDITPDQSVFLFGYPHVERMSTGVHDPLLASAVAFGDANRQTAVFVGCDIIWVPKAISGPARRRISEQTGVPVESIMITGTHTHSGPITAQIASNLNDTVVPPPDEAYGKQLEDRIVEAGCAAVEAMRPCTLVHATADGSQLGTNRHDPKGPAIPQVPALLARSIQDDQPVAVMCVCSMHPTVLHEDSTVISGDFPGLARKHLQTTYNFNCPIVYHMGISGNQSPRHVVRQNTLEETDRLGGILADAIVAALDQSTAVEPAELNVRSSLIKELPVRVFPDPDQAQADAQRATETLEGLRQQQADPATVRSAECDWFGAEETLTLAKLKAKGKLDDFVQACLPAEVQVIRLGQIAFVGWPGEVFVEFALDLMQRHPDAVVISLANGDTQGYLVTQDGIDRRCYEAGNALFQSPESAEMLVTTSDKLLRV